MSATNLEIITAAYQKINVIDETEAPSPEQGVTALAVLNDWMADLARDSVHLGWFPQTDMTETAPLQDSDIRGVKLGLAQELASHFGIPIKAELAENIASAYTKLIKRTRPYVEADLGDLPAAQSRPWGLGR